MRKIIVAIIVVLVIAGAYYLITNQAEKSRPRIVKTNAEEQQDLVTVDKLLKESKTEEALKILKDYETAISIKTLNGQKWLDLFIKANEQLYNSNQLVLLYESYPEAFEQKEKASLLVGEMLISLGKYKEFEKLRSKWDSKETIPENWLALDADYLSSTGKRNEAIEKLKSRKFSGDKDVSRLLRLGILVADEDPAAAWDYIAEAYNKQPDNVVTRIYRARLLEIAGKSNLALKEYLNAIQSMPNSIGLRDQLAEFYLRNNQFTQALQIWGKNLNSPLAESIWLKALFWSKVALPLKVDFKALEQPEGRLQPLISYIIDLPQGEFWNDSQFKNVPHGESYLTEQQSTYWLRLLALLKDEDEKGALDFIQTNQTLFEKKLWAPHLNSALKHALTYRLKGKFISDGSAHNEGVKDIKEADDIHEQLDILSASDGINRARQEIPADLKALLDSKEIFSALFLASGWLNAGVELNILETYPEAFPQWVAYAMTEALRFVRTNDEALTFAQKQKKTPILNVLIGELLFANKQNDEALKILAPYKLEQDTVGIRAAWLTSSIYQDKKDFNLAKESVMKNKMLAASVLGQEALAKIALQQNDISLAAKIYAALKNTSADAKSFLAQKAFLEKKWGEARELTQDLLQAHPNDQTLWDNLERIKEEEAQEKNQGKLSEKVEKSIKDKGQ